MHNAIWGQSTSPHVCIQTPGGAVGFRMISLIRGAPVPTGNRMSSGHGHAEQEAGADAA